MVMSVCPMSECPILKIICDVCGNIFDENIENRKIARGKLQELCRVFSAGCYRNEAYLCAQWYLWSVFTDENVGWWEGKLITFVKDDIALKKATVGEGKINAFTMFETQDKLKDYIVTKEEHDEYYKEAVETHKDKFKEWCYWALVEPNSASKKSTK